MTRLRGRNLIGQRVNDKAPVNYESTTMISSVDIKGKTNCLVIKGAMNGEIFKKYVSKILAPKLEKGDIVIMDNLSSHKNQDAIKKIEKLGAKVLFLPPYSPDYNPIEKMWSKVKEYLRSVKARNWDDLIKAIQQGLNKVSSQDCIGWFQSCGYLSA